MKVQSDDGVAGDLALGDEFIDFFAFGQDFARAHGIGRLVGARLGKRREVSADHDELAFALDDMGVGDLNFSCPYGFDFPAEQDQPHLETLLDEVFMECFAVVADGGHVVFQKAQVSWHYTLKSQRSKLKAWLVSNPGDLWHNIAMSKASRQVSLHVIPVPSALKKLVPKKSRELARAHWVHGNAERGQAAVEASRPDARNFRDLFAVLAQKPESVAQWAIARGMALAKSHWASRGERHQAWCSQRASIIAATRDMDSQNAMALAGMEAGVSTLSESGWIPQPGELAPESSSQERLERFLERRDDPSWARRLRREHGSFFMGDAMLLALLRRVGPEDASQVLNNLLLCAALSGGGVQAALSLGADPMGLCYYGWKSSPTNLLGAVLRLSPRYELSGHVPEHFASGKDALLEQSVDVALACAPAGDMDRFLSLLATGARRPSHWLGACALSAQRGHLRCALKFLDMGQPLSLHQLSSAAAARPSEIDPMGFMRFPKQSKLAWERFDALAEASMLKAITRPKAGAAPKTRKAPRL
jgi:hypothetical protein